jgi:hypothetical protein
MQANTLAVSRLNLEDMLAAARAATGLSDLGEPDILPGLAVLTEALINEARLHPLGVETQRAALTNLISSRLRIADTLARHPEILEEEIMGPIIVTGLARSGTTKMQRMMANDAALKTLPLWRILNPMPLSPAQPGVPDPRIAATEQISALMRDHFPDFFAGHPMIAAEPDEESLMSDLAMRGSFTGHACRIPSFDAWMDRQDHHPWYDLLSRMLQIFQWQDGGPRKTWLLKSPSHLGHLDALFEVFPNATVVHCHRDPVMTTASIAQLSEAGRRMYSDVEDLHTTSRYVLKYWSGLMQSYVELRPAYEEQHCFVDVAYREICGDTMAAIARVYGAANLTLTPQARAAMQEWEAANPPGKHGQHRYALEGSGLTAADVRAAFAGYLERFGGLI